jgi:uncharacterized protein (UPF0335 family)
MTEIAAERLRSIVERIERLESACVSRRQTIKDIYAEAKGAGFDVKVLRALIVLRGKDPAEVEEQEAFLEIYRAALA